MALNFRTSGLGLSFQLLFSMTWSPQMTTFSSKYFWWTWLNLRLPTLFLERVQLLEFSDSQKRMKLNYYHSCHYIGQNAQMIKCFLNMLIMPTNKTLFLGNDNAPYDRIFSQFQSNVLGNPVTLILAKMAKTVSSFLQHDDRFCISPGTDKINLFAVTKGWSLDNLHFDAWLLRLLSIPVRPGLHVKLDCT